MDTQYAEFKRLEFGCPLQHKNHFEKQSQLARKYQMDANCFVVSLRRRGLKLALRDLNIERVIIDEDYPDRPVAVGGQQLSFFPAHTITKVTAPESKWSTAFSR
jgi:hypothetical protein